MIADDAFWARVDKSGDCWLWTGSCTPKGYGHLRRGGKVVYTHRHVMTLMGVDIAGLQVDHVCHNRSCVRPEHLRPVTNKQNSENLTGAYANSKSGIRGVYWDKRARSWCACVGHAGRIYSKRCSSIEEAAEWARLKRIELFTHNDADRIGA